MNNIGSYLVFHLLLIEENTGHPLIILICHKVGLPFSLLLISIHQNLDSFLIHFFCGLFIYSDTLAKSIIMNKMSMMQLSLSMYILKDTCIFYLYLICIMKILLYCKDPHVLFISQEGQFALKKIVLQGFTYIYQLRETIYFLGELIVFLGLRSHCSLYK